MQEPRDAMTADMPPRGPQLRVLLAEPVEIRTLLAAEQALVSRAGLASINTGLPDPAGQAAGRQAKALGNGSAGDLLLQAKRNSLRMLLRRELASGLGG